MQTTSRCARTKQPSATEFERELEAHRFLRPFGGRSGTCTKLTCEATVCKKTDVADPTCTKPRRSRSQHLLSCLPLYHIGRVTMVKQKRNTNQKQLPQHFCAQVTTGARTYVFCLRNLTSPNMTQFLTVASDDSTMCRDMVRRLCAFPPCTSSHGNIPPANSRARATWVPQNGKRQVAEPHRTKNWTEIVEHLSAASAQYRQGQQTQAVEKRQCQNHNENRNFYATRRVPTSPRRTLESKTSKKR